MREFSIKDAAYKMLVLVALLTIILQVTACNTEEEPGEVIEIARNVRVLELTSESMSEYFEVTGSVAPVRGADLSAQESGVVVAIAAAKGAKVKANQNVLEQDRKILLADKKSTAAALETQAYNVDKVRQLNKAGKVSRFELLTAESEFEQARGLASVAAERYQRAGVKAPFDGVVVDRYVELGELVSPGEVVARVIDPYTLKITAFLTDQQIAWINVEDKALITMGQSENAVEGVVSWIGFEADRTTGKFKVELEIDNQELVHRSGVIGRVRLTKNEISNVIAIPRDAVLNGRTGNSAYVIEGDRAVKRFLELGVDQGLMVVVKSGLKAGEKLVVRGHRELRDGSLVKITETAVAKDGSMEIDPVEITAGSSNVRISAEAGQ